MLVRVQLVSCVMPGRESKISLRSAISTKWITQAPVGDGKRAEVSDGELLGGWGCEASAPLPLTQEALRLGSADWSLNCSGDSGGSLYMRTLLERRRRPCLLEFMFSLSLSLSLSLAAAGPALVPGAKERVRGRRIEDSLTVDVWKLGLELCSCGEGCLQTGTRDSRGGSL